MTQTKAKASNSIFTISRMFDAPLDSVWKAWTDAKQSKEWFGPKGCTVKYHSFDIKPGGKASYSIEFEGKKMSGQWAYKEVKPKEKLVALVAFTDEKGNIVPHPGMPSWPREMHSTVRFFTRGNKTEVMVEWYPHNPSAAEQQVFDQNHASMQQGWGGSFDSLAEYLRG